MLIRPPAFPTMIKGESPRREISDISSQPGSDNVFACFPVSISQKVKAPVWVPLMISLLIGSYCKADMITDLSISIVLIVSESDKSLSSVILITPSIEQVITCPKSPPSSSLKGA